MRHDVTTWHSILSGMATKEDGRELPKKEAEFLAPYCSKRYLFDLLAVFSAPGVLPSRILKVCECFSKDNARWGWILLCSLRPPKEDPLNWCPTKAEFGFFHGMLGMFEGASFNHGEAQVLGHFPLVALAGDVLMSGAFGGCGSDTIRAWATPKFYDQLLAEEHSFHDESGVDPISHARSLIGRVAHILEELGLPRMSLGIGAAASYYGGDEALHRAKTLLIDWLLDEGIGPSLIDMVLADLLTPKNGLLLPNIPRLHSSQDRELVRKSLLGFPNLTPVIAGLRNLLEGKLQTGDALVDEVAVSHLRWHHSMGLVEEIMEELSR